MRFLQAKNSSHLLPGGSGYVGTMGPVPSAGLDVTALGLTVTRVVSFPAELLESKIMLEGGKPVTVNGPAGPTGSTSLLLSFVF